LKYNLKQFFNMTNNNHTLVGFNDNGKF
jgi:hypothetical protein